MEQLFEEERKARMDSDLKRLGEIQHQIINSCSTDNEVITALKMLTHKRKQDPHCIKDLVLRLYNEKRSIDFYKMLLSDVIENRIYLEEERLYISEHIKNMFGNDIEKAYMTIKDVSVEAFTSINEKRRNSFLFEQFRLALLLRLYSDASLISKRVRKSYLSNEEAIIFYNYSILLKIGEEKYLETAKLFMELAKVDQTSRGVARGSFFCMLSNCFSEKRNILEEKKKLLEEFLAKEQNEPVMRSYISNFCSNMVLNSELANEILAEMSRIDNNENEQGVNEKNKAIYISRLKDSIIEHNIFVIKKFVSQIELSQLAFMLGLSEEETVSFITTIVNEKYGVIKINQPEGLVDLGEKGMPDKVDNLLDKIVEACNLIQQDSIKR